MAKEAGREWLKPLGDFRNLLAFERWNPHKRRWLARRLNDDGTINLLPVSYSAQHCEDMLRYILTIQLRENKATYLKGIPPRFTLLSEVDVIAIQLLWSRYGFHTGAKALEIWRDIMIHGNEYSMPYIDPDAESPFTRADINDKDPDFRNLPFADHHFDTLFNGFRDVESASAGCERLVTKKGIYYSEAITANEFDIDPEGAALLMDFELDHVIESASERHASSVFHRLIRMGTVTLRKGSESEQSRMLNTANQLERIGLVSFDNDPHMIRQKLIDYHVLTGRHARIQSTLT